LHSMTDRSDIPSGVEHLKMVAELEAVTHSQSSKRLKASGPHYQLIGTRLCQCKVRHLPS
jgi:hypothetical protein